MQNDQAEKALALKYRPVLRTIGAHESSPTSKRHLANLEEESR